MLSSSDEGQSAQSAERSGLPEMETIRSEPPGHGAHLAFACFQRDLLREHNVSDRQSADRHETQSLLQATPLVDLAHVHRGPDVDPVPLSAVASDNLEVALPGELLPLRRRQPLSQQPQRPALPLAITALLRLLIAEDLGLVTGRNRGLSRENMPSQDAGRPLIAAVHSRSPRCPKCGAMMSLRIIEPERQPLRVKTGKAQCEHMFSA